MFALHCLKMLCWKGGKRSRNYCLYLKLYRELLNQRSQIRLCMASGVTTVQSRAFKIVCLIQGIWFRIGTLCSISFSFIVYFFLKRRISAFKWKHVYPSIPYVWILSFQQEIKIFHAKNKSLLPGSASLGILAGINWIRSQPDLISTVFLKNLSSTRKNRSLERYTTFHMNF